MASIEKSPEESPLIEDGQEPDDGRVIEVDIEAEALKLANMLVYLFQNGLTPDAPAFFNYMNENGLDTDQFRALIEQLTVSQGRLSATELESFEKSIETERG